MGRMPNKVAVLVSLVFGVAVWLTIDPWFTKREALRISIASCILCTILLHVLPQIMSKLISIVIAIGIGLAGWLIVDPWYNTKDARLIGIAVFVASVILLQFKPKLMGSLHEDDGDQTEDDREGRERDELDP